MWHEGWKDGRMEGWEDGRMVEDQYHASTILGDFFTFLVALCQSCIYPFICYNLCAHLMFVGLVLYQVLLTNEDWYCALTPNHAQCSCV